MQLDVTASRGLLLQLLRLGHIDAADDRCRSSVAQSHRLTSSAEQLVPLGGFQQLLILDPRHEGRLSAVMHRAE